MITIKCYKQLKHLFWWMSRSFSFQLKELEQLLQLYYKLFSKKWKRKKRKIN